MDSATLGKRTFNSVIILALVGLVTFFFPNWVFSLLASVLTGFALWEFFGAAEKKGIFVYKYFGATVGMLVPLMVNFQMGAEGYFTTEPFFIVITCLFLFVLLFIRRETADALASIAVTMFALLYIAWFFSFFVKIKFMPNGARLVAFLILVTKMGDIGAYFVGSTIGKRPLIPRISPRKTVEGTIGGLIFSVIAALAGKLYLPFFHFAHLLILGVLLGILALVGDLAESLIKRDCKVKDSGATFSGFGGVLDMIDSLLFTAPIFYLYLKVVIK